MLSKKYYIVFARMIGESEDLEEFTKKLCIFLKEDNLNFDYSRFIQAINNAYTEQKIKQDIEKEQTIRTNYRRMIKND
jgi:hypothetical protein